MPKGKPPKRKREKTLHFVEGLLCSADKIYPPSEADFHPRETLHGAFDLSAATPEEVEEMGKYQGRVVLVSLAAELALKFAYELEKSEKIATTNHDLEYWFKKLSETLRKSVESHYSHLATPPQNGWMTAADAFEKCKNSSLEWRYIVEEGEGPQDIMRATYLKYATLSVVAATRESSKGN